MSILLISIAARAPEEYLEETPEEETASSDETVDDSNLIQKNMRAAVLPIAATSFTASPTYGTILQYYCQRTWFGGLQCRCGPDAVFKQDRVPEMTCESLAQDTQDTLMNPYRRKMR